MPIAASPLFSLDEATDQFRRLTTKILWKKVVKEQEDLGRESRGLGRCQKQGFT
jgi:hypothetical protein